MLIREHRGSFQESMLTVTEIPNTLDAVVKHARDKLNMFGVEVNEVAVDFYAYDPRNNWKTYIVTIEGYGVFGFCDSEVKP